MIRCVFFFQAEDGIRDADVTGVQTCALPISVNGDLNSRRARLQGMEPKGGMTTIKADVPMAEILTYAQSLTSLTGGRGDYHMHFLRYEEVPAHVAQKVMAEAKK